jgi:hypothetical protein
MFSYTIKSAIDGNTYTGAMVGRSPFFHGARTTNIKTVVVPIIVKMKDGGVFDPTKTDAACSLAVTPSSLVQNSPIFKTHDFVLNGIDVGTSQYIDAFQRASFWTNVQVTGSRYHNVMSPITVASPVTFSPATGQGKTFAKGFFVGQTCALGVVDTAVLDSFLQNTAIPSLVTQGVVSPTSFPFFIFYNVVQAEGGDDPTVDPCCILGFHNAFGFPVQTYGIADFDLTGVFTDSSDTSTIAHEVGEWMDDPLGGNPVPAWGHIGQQPNCQNNLEVGDPLSGTNIPGVLMPNGFTYNLQELVFFSWFYRQNPSLGTNGDFSDNGAFTVDAGPVCF